MNKPGTGTALAGSGIVVAAAAALITTGGIELAGQKHPDIWSNAWMTGGIAVLGLGVLLAVLFFLTDIFGRRSGDAPGQSVPPRGATAALRGLDRAEYAETVPDEDQAWQTSWSLAEPEAPPEEAGETEALPGPAFTGRWQHTADGFRASPLMNMVHTAMPGYTGMPGGPPFVRIGVCVAADPLPPDASSGQMGARFTDFLGRDPVAGLIKAMTYVDDGTSWTRLAGNGPLRLDAVLGSADQDAIPAASAMLLPPVTGMSSYGRADGIACLWLHIEPRGQDGRPPSAGLAEWHDRMCRAVSVAGALTDFLDADLGLATRNDPAPRVGVLLQAPGGSMPELVDPGELHALPGAATSSQFLGYALADPAGKSAAGVACDLLRQLCDHTLYLADFEPVLAAIRPWLQPGSSISVPRPDGTRVTGTVLRTDASATDPRIFVAVPVEGSDEPLPQAFSARVVTPAREDAEGQGRP